jgi:hypothetical protein
MPSPTISVTTPAEDLTYLSIEELRAAVGITGGSRDPDLQRVGGRVAAAITEACKVATDGATPPTLRKETITDTFRLSRTMTRLHYTDPAPLHLSRRPIVSIASVVAAGTALDPASYEIRAGEGAIYRLAGDGRCDWSVGTTVVVYDAGWVTVPERLKLANEKLMRLYWFENGRDPSERQISIPGVIEVQRWIGAPADPSIPQDVMDDLGPYINLLA